MSRTFNTETALCLACSCSLPPRMSAEASSDLFMTPCCRRPICPRCVQANPRLTRYNPCLHCLGGAGAVSVRFPNSSGGKPLGAVSNTRPNVDGAVRDQDVFVLGDDDADERDNETPSDSEEESPAPATPPPAYADAHPGLAKQPEPDHQASSTDLVQPNGTPPRYYIKPDDTLIGIALKLGVDGRALCRLNGLLPSTLRTTPHLLHTRSFLVLPSSVSSSAVDSHRPSAEEEAAHKSRIARQRAEQRLRTLTKEHDWRVARAYVAVADLDENSDDAHIHVDKSSFESAGGKRADTLRKRHVSGSSLGAEAQGSLEARAVDRYLDDEEWEQRERREGRGVAIPTFPYLQDRWRTIARTGAEKARKAWWDWQR